MGGGGGGTRRNILEACKCLGRKAWECFETRWVGVLGREVWEY